MDLAPYDSNTPHLSSLSYLELPIASQNGFRLLDLNGILNERMKEVIKRF